MQNKTLVERMDLKGEIENKNSNGGEIKWTSCLM
jgi:hypothetical protein